MQLDKSDIVTLSAMTMVLNYIYSLNGQNDLLWIILVKIVRFMYDDEVNKLLLLIQFIVHINIFAMLLYIVLLEKC